jgi:hypothetical protein
MALRCCRQKASLWRELIDSCQNSDTRHGVPVSKSFLTSGSRGALSYWRGLSMDIETVEDQKMPRITHEFGLALKVQLSNVRTDTESGGKADARGT